MRYLLFFTLIIFLASCGKDDEVTDFTEANEKEIQDYIQAQGLNAQRSETGLYYVINEPGTGAQPIATSNVTVAYKGYYTNGAVFDQSGPNGISFPLTGVIPGWTEGIAYFKEGGSGILLIPSSLGYGPSDFSGIPGGSVLIFDVALLSVN